MTAIVRKPMFVVTRRSDGAIYCVDKTWKTPAEAASPRAMITRYFSRAVAAKWHPDGDIHQIEYGKDTDVKFARTMSSVIATTGAHNPGSKVQVLGSAL